MGLNLLPSRRLIALVAVAAALFPLSAAVAWTFDALLLAALVLDAALASGASVLRVSREAPSRVSLGSRADVRLIVANRARRAVRVGLTDDLPPGLARVGPDVQDRWVPAGRAVDAGYALRAESRGDAVIGDVHLRALGPLGLVWRQRRLARRDAVRVQPGIAAVRRHRLLGLRTTIEPAGARSVRRPGGAGSFESLREYVRGDDPRRIDWKATARRGTLMVRRYEVERSQNVVLAIDAGRLMRERVDHRARIDHALAAALLLADVASHHRDRVGLLVFADRVQQFLPPRRLDLPRMADALADVDARAVEPNYPAAFGHLRRQLRRRCLIVLFTDVIDRQASHALVAHLSRAASHHLALAVALRNPELEAATASPVADAEGVYRRAAAEELVQSRSRALVAMRRAGVLVADTAPDDAIEVVVNRYLEIKSRGLL